MIEDSWDWPISFIKGRVVWEEIKTAVEMRLSIIIIESDFQFVIKVIESNIKSPSSNNLIQDIRQLIKIFKASSLYIVII